MVALPHPPSSASGCADTSSLGDARCCLVSHEWRVPAHGRRRAAVLPCNMPTAQRSGHAARTIVGLGHLLVGVAAFVFAGVMIVAGSDSGAELGEVLLPLGLLLSLAAGVFTYTAAMALRRAPRDRH